jgi:hypothetical protein
MMVASPDPRKDVEVSVVQSVPFSNRVWTVVESLGKTGGDLSPFGAFCLFSEHASQSGSQN